MKLRLLAPVLILVLAASLFGPFGGVTTAQAQTCTDATGATVPCPPSGGDSGSDDTDDSGGNGGGGQPGGGNPNPPTDITATPSPTPSPEPTNTPLPISDKPTEDPTKNAPSYDVTPTPTSGPVIASNDPSADPNSAPGIPWGPIGLAAIVIVLLMGILLPAVQKFKNKPDAPQGRSWDTFGDIKGDNAVPNPTPQTREHILLAKQENGSTSGASKPKPKPAPKPTPPPSQPKPPSSGVPGDFDSDGSVDGRDFNKSSSDGSGSGRDVIITREDKDKE